MKNRTSIVVFLAAFIGVAVGVEVWKALGSKELKTTSDVQDQLIGVWTHTKPVGNNEPYGWERWTFTSNSVEIQSAQPSDISWGKPSSTFPGVEVSRRKTADTGQWYWHIHINGSALNAAMFDNKNVVTVFGIGAPNHYDLRKEDKDLTK